MTLPNKLFVVPDRYGKPVKKSRPKGLPESLVVLSDCVEARRYIHRESVGANLFGMHRPCCYGSAFCIAYVLHLHRGGAVPYCAAVLVRPRTARLVILAAT